MDNYESLSHTKWECKHHVVFIRVGATTVKQILRGSGIHPAPDKAFKRPAVPWTTFVHAHMDSLVGTDFFTERVYTLRGALTAYVLVFIHLGSRKVYYSPSTYNPTGDWVMQQTRSASMWLDDMGVKARFLIHDRDGEQREVPYATHFPYVQRWSG